MSKLWARFAGLFSSKNFVGIDKAGNRYFKRTEELDGIMKEKRWMTFKGEEDPTSIPGGGSGWDGQGWGLGAFGSGEEIMNLEFEWICWLNGQRKSAPTPEEMAELEARREFVKLNIARLKKEEEERMAKEGKRKATNIGKADGPDLKSFVQQFPDASEGLMLIHITIHLFVLTCKGGSVGCAWGFHSGGDKTAEASDTQKEKRSTEPTGSGESFRPGTWQPPT
ncbi:hypothetical protein RND71_024212 [Anisodus tanguticus]|uniref:NADH dehydrogenase [ubiquinone] 1 alpha subcomplex subunit 12 n=1 Tax=Anisodus tanguticus TaxID=243964 RepID=A0AAE1V980_9SOLA|nr:hypothetical protein RND71_024212 [Anisodus tanguticus]